MAIKSKCKPFYDALKQENSVALALLAINTPICFSHRVRPGRVSGSAI